MSPSPQGFSLGKVPRSKSSTVRPCRPSMIASPAPAMPPPAIKTSTIINLRLKDSPPKARLGPHDLAVNRIGEKNRFFHGDSPAEDPNVSRAAQQRRQPCGVDERQRPKLDEDREIIRVAYPTVRAVRDHAER